jgi:inorganic pyrophosphatase
MNLWKDIETGSKSPEEVFVVVETPNGSRNKYECNSKWNTVHQGKEH